MIFNVKGMVCTGCEKRISKAISNMEYVEKVSANHKTGQVLVSVNASAPSDLKARIIAALKELDFEVIEEDE